MTKDFERYIAVVFIALGIMGLLGFLDNYFVEQVVTPVAIDNVNVTNSWIKNGTKYTSLANGTLLESPVTSIFRTYWFVPVGFGLFILASTDLIGMIGSGGGTSWDYPSSPTPPRRFEVEEADEEDEEEEIEEADFEETDGGVKSYKCPNCGAPLKFHGRSVTTCDHCGREAEKS